MFWLSVFYCSCIVSMCVCHVMNNNLLTYLFTIRHSGQIFTWRLFTWNLYMYLQMPTSVLNFNFLALLVSKGVPEGVPKYNVGLIAPCRTLYAETFTRAPSTYQDQTACQILSIVSSCIMQLCQYVCPVGFSLYVPENVFLGGLRMKMWKYCVLTPKRHYPAWIRVCWCIACQNRFNALAARSVERFCVQRKK